MVATENQDAARAGLEILMRGGNAVDAACATALALGVASPSSSGIGGGGFMLIHMAREGRYYGLDFRDCAPLGASASLYAARAKSDGDAARLGALAVAVPGEVAGLAEALHNLGTMRFSEVAGPAIRLAREGFPLSDHLAADIARLAPVLSRDHALARTFLTAGQTPRGRGEKLRAPALGATLSAMGDRPREVFYRGPIARQIAACVKEAGGLLTVDDLAAYRALWREPISGTYRGHEIRSLPPPASGAVMLEMLAMVEADAFGHLGADSPEYLSRIVEVMHQGFGDRATLGDPAFVKVDSSRLLLPEHVQAARTRALKRDRSWTIPKPGGHGTSSLCVVDGDRNVVVLTSTINTSFGAKLTVPELGIILNDSMDDFTVMPGVPNAARLIGGEANLIEGGKRPLSSITPAIFIRDGAPVLCVGGSGGPTIITGVFQTALNLFDFGLDPGEAVSRPRVHAQRWPERVLVESGLPAATCHALEELGYGLREIPALRAAISAVHIEPDRLIGAADPRKGGGLAGN